MNIRVYEVLEFDRIREQLANLAETKPGKARALALEASCDKERVLRELGETSEARRLDDDGEAVALHELPDVAPFSTPSASKGDRSRWRISWRSLLLRVSPKTREPGDVYDVGARRIFLEERGRDGGR